MYNKEEFKERLQQELMEMFPDREVGFTSITVDGKKRDGFRMDKEIECATPVILLDSCYEIYKDSEDFSCVLSFVKTVMQENVDDLNTLKYFKTYFDKSLSINLFDTHIRPEIYNTITRPFGDLVQVLVLIRKVEENVYQRLILTGDTLDSFKDCIGDRTLDDLWALAKKNIEDYTYSFIEISRLLGVRSSTEDYVDKDRDATSFKFKTSDLQKKLTLDRLKTYIKKTAHYGAEMYVIRIEGIKNATPVLLNARLLKGLAIAFNSSFYILPSSTDELIVISDYGAPGDEMIKQTIWETNRNVVKENDLFTDELFHYDLQYEEVEFLGRYEQIKVG